MYFFNLTNTKRGGKMKNFKRFLTAILSLAIILSISISCFGVIFVPVIQPVEGLPAYTLNEEYVKQTKSYLQTAKNYTINNKDVEASVEWTNFNLAYYEVASQANVAFVLYASDASNQTYKNNYKFASEAYNEIYSSYMLALQDIYKAEGRDGFLSSLSDDDLNRILKYSQDIETLENQVNDLQIEYAEISDEQFNEKTVQIYKQIVEVNNQIAIAYGFENYYEYASDYVYGRDYSNQELQEFRLNVGAKLPAIITQLKKDVNDAKEKLAEIEVKNLDKLLSNPYNSTEVNYWDKYVESYGSGEVKNDLSHAFKNNNVLFGNGANSRQMAFTAYMPAYNKSFCYFGPKYQDAFTVAHEIGHYFAGMYVSQGSASMDLNETHSQCNEMLLLEYLSSELNATSFKALELSKLSSILSTVVVSTIVDNFEYYVYTHVEEIKNYTAQDFDNKMNEICNNYGGRTFVDTVVIDINRYWRLVVAEQPLYYISYATSGVASISLYVEADSSRAGARSIYVSLIKQHLEDKGFEANLTNAGLVSPFKKDAFNRIETFLLGNKVDEPSQSEQESSIEQESSSQSEQESSMAA